MNDHNNNNNNNNNNRFSTRRRRRSNSSNNNKYDDHHQRQHHPGWSSSSSSSSSSSRRRCCSYKKKKTTTTTTAATTRMMKKSRQPIILLMMMTLLLLLLLLPFLALQTTTNNNNFLFVSSFVIIDSITATTNHHHHHHHLIRRRKQQQQQQILPPSTSSSTTSSSSSSSTLYMCQLLGMNCATPTDFTFSFSGFVQRGGLTDIHSDGWGLAIYENYGLRQFHDIEAASKSSLAQFLSTNPIKTQNMMGHIRYATQGSINMSNVHPFCREMWGIQWCFAHNGEVPLYSIDSSSNSNNQSRILMSLIVDDDDLDYEDNNNNDCCYQQFYHPIGTTDSEATFCAILNALRNKFGATSLPSLPVLYEAISKLCTEIVNYDNKNTILNFLLTCGQHTQWVYSYPGSRRGSKIWNGLYYTTRSYPFNKQTSLNDIDYIVDFSTCTTINDCVSVIATAPLTNDEEWIELNKNELILFDNGKPQKTIKDLFRVELLGHGLNSTVLPPTQLDDDFLKFEINPIELDYFQGHGI